MKRALVVWNRGLQFVGNSGSGHAIVVDAPRDDGGSASGPSNTELLLIAFGGCTGMDVALILGKMRVEFDDFEIALEGEVPAEYPKTMTRIHNQPSSCRERNTALSGTRSTVRPTSPTSIVSTPTVDGGAARLFHPDGGPAARRLPLLSDS